MAVLTRGNVPITATITGGTNTSGDSNYNDELNALLSLLDGTGDFDVIHKQGLVVNGSSANFDTQIKGQTDENTLYVDASADSVGFGTKDPLAKIHVDAKNDTAAGLYAILDSTSATPADNDKRSVEYRQRNDGGANVPYAKQTITALDVSSGTEKGKITWSIADGITGAIVDIVELDIGGVTIAGLLTVTGEIVVGNLSLENGQLFEIYNAGENITLNDALRFSGTQAFIADNTSQAGVENFVGFASETITLGNPIKVSTRRVLGLSGLTGGAIQFLGAAGAITSTKPTTGYVRPIGFAESTTTLRISNFPESIYRSKLIERVNLPFDDRDFSGGSFVRMFDYESGPAQTAFINSVMGDNNVFLIVAITGSAAPPREFSIRFITSASVVRFETSALVIGNQALSEMTWLVFDLKSGNVVNWDPVTQILVGLNDGAASGEAWEVQVNADVGGGAYRIKQLYVALLESGL